MKKKSPILETFGQNVRTLREAQSLSQEDFASVVGLDRTYVGGIERGERNAGLLNICRIANALKVPPAKLLAGLDATSTKDKNISFASTVNVKGDRR